MNKNLYIGNLPAKVTEDDLRTNFSEVGKVVSVNVIKDKFTRNIQRVWVRGDGDGRTGAGSHPEV